MKHLAELTVDRSAVATNTRLFAERCSGALMAVLKADAFGHGDLAETVLDNGAIWLGAATVQEALALRLSAPEAPILAWLTAVGEDFAIPVQAGIDLAVPSAEHLRAIARASRRVRRKARIHLHIDVGINRDGASIFEWVALCELAALLEREGAINVVGVMGHLSSASTPTAPMNDRELLRFQNAVQVVRRHGLRPTVRHLAATAATLALPSTHFDLSRIGAGLYGIDPSETTSLTPALTLTAPIVMTRDVPAFSGIGYNHTAVTRRATTLALLPVGYGDGLPRLASSRAAVFIRGRRHAVVGRISMDQTVVDVGDAGVVPGDVAMIFGPGLKGEPTVREWAQWSSTIEHEIVVGIGARIHRRMI